MIIVFGAESGGMVDQRQPTGAGQPAMAEEGKLFAPETTRHKRPGDGVGPTARLISRAIGPFRTLPRAC